jgi:nuclear pore complex protein Nup62
LSPQVSGALSVLATELTRSVDHVNDLAAASLGDPSTPMGSVVRVLNGQLQALNQLEGRIEELNGQLEALKVAAPGLTGGSGFGGMIRAA